MREATYIIRIEIFQDRSQGLLGLSQKSYINKVQRDLKWINAHLVLFQFKREINCLMQYPKNKLECKQMETIPYISIVKA